MNRGQPKSPLLSGEAIEPTPFRPAGALIGFAWPTLPWLPLLACVGLLSAAGLVWFLINARSVELTVSPADAHLRASRGFTPHLGSRWMMLPGERDIEASAPGYHQLQETLSISEEPHQTFLLTLRPLPGNLLVTVNPPTESVVDVDDQPVGKAPGRITGVAAGVHQITVRAPRYLEFRTSLAVAGKDATQPLAVTLRPAWSPFTVTTVPPGAQVLDTTQPLGITPLSAELLQGRRQITLLKPGFKPWTRRIQIVAGLALNLGEVPLLKDDGYLNITSTPRSAAVAVDGVYQGETPVKVAVGPDVSHQITLLKVGYLDSQANFASASGETREIPFALTPELGVIELLSAPADAELLVDGVSLGQVKEHLELPICEHEIVLRKPGFAPYRTLVVPRRGHTKRLQIRLKVAIR